MKVLVTGSEGSLMQFVIPHFLKAGHTVRGVDNFFRYGKVKRKRDYEFIQGDLCEEALVKRSLKGVDLVIQAAARIFGVMGFHKYPADILSRDVQLHQHVLWNAKNHDTVKKVVFLSSSMVYERCETVPSVEADVDEMRIPYTDYGLSKLVGERLCRAFQQQYGLTYTIWRPFNIITPFERAEQGEPGISHVFADFIDRLIIKKELPLKILGDGKQIRCFTWIEDVARGIAQFSADPRTDNQAFNLGNTERVAMSELARKIFKLGQQKGVIKKDAKLTFKHLPVYKDDVRIRVPSNDKAMKKLKWKPTVLVDEAIDRCVDQAISLAGK